MAEAQPAGRDRVDIYGNLAPLNEQKQQQPAEAQYTIAYFRARLNIAHERNKSSISWLFGLSLLCAAATALTITAIAKTPNHSVVVVTAVYYIALVLICYFFTVFLNELANRRLALKFSPANEVRILQNLPSRNVTLARFLLSFAFLIVWFVAFVVGVFEFQLANDPVLVVYWRIIWSWTIEILDIFCFVSLTKTVQDRLNTEAVISAMRTEGYQEIGRLIVRPNQAADPHAVV
jgi:hypothetical protein